MEEYPNQEWFAYLVGRISEDKDFFVGDISVPPHKEVSSVSAEAEPFHIPSRCIGVIHSHHHMGAFHSSIDNGYVDKAYPVSITVAKGQGYAYDVISYQSTPCGKATTVKCSIKYVEPEPLFDRKGFLGKAKANIEKGRRSYVNQRRKDTPYVPIRYRFDKAGTITVDEEGVVIPPDELHELMREVWNGG